MKTAIVTTTINIPEFLEAYCRDSAEFGRKDLVFVVVADRKTPPEAQEYCKRLEKTHGFPVEYFDLDRQQAYLRNFPELDEYLPYNSVQRRNIGMVYAYEIDCATIITVDDDNYLIAPNLLEAHLRVGREATLKSYSSETGWLNPCQFLTVTPPFLTYHRGFPLSQRHVDSPLSEKPSTGRVVVNVGMWLGDPDVDAWIRMSVPLIATRWIPTESFALAPGTWAPFNSQQTAVARELVPAYFLNPNAGRYDDIWASYILHRIANQLGHLVTYGAPVVDHKQKRSLASLWRDLDDERMGTLLTDKFVAILRDTRLQSSTYQACYAEIAESLSGSLSKHPLSEPQQAYLQEYVRGMRMWQKTFARLTERSASLVSR
ncbi:MAG TPA: hypothetical protein VE263_13450 [Candidatus Angelobacter sp.]|nr:hypothetical protein [Candidatus Angelobacter sp.]